MVVVHPWISFLPDQHTTGSMVEMAVKDDPSELGDFSFPDLLDGGPLGSTLILSTSTVVAIDIEIHVYEFHAQLRQPFGILLLASNP